MYKEYLELKTNEKKLTHIKVDVGYELGGVNWYNSTLNKRGYYVYVTPVELDDNCEGFMLGDGYKYLVLEVSRKSQKALDKVNAMAKEVALPLIEKILQEKGLELKEV